MARATAKKIHACVGKPEPAFLADEEEAFGEVGVGDRAARDGLGESAEERVGAERDDERRQAQRGDEDGVEPAGERADGRG